MTSPSWFSCCGYDPNAESEATLYVPSLVAEKSAETRSDTLTQESTDVEVVGRGNSSIRGRQGAGADEDVTSLDSGSVSSSLYITPEEKEKEKKRLQEMVKEFAQQSLGGVYCENIRVNENNNKQVEPSKYSVDSTLDNFTLSFESGSKVTLPMITISEVLSYEELFQSSNGETLTTEVPINQLTDNEKSRLIILEHSHEGLQRRYILVGDAPSRKTFISCLKILTLYAKVQTQTPPTN